MSQEKAWKDALNYAQAWRDAYPLMAHQGDCATDEGESCDCGVRTLTEAAAGMYEASTGQSWIDAPTGIRHSWMERAMERRDT